MIPLIFVFGIFTLGITYTWVRWGVNKSISATFYEHENKALWYLWCILYSVPVLIAVPHGLIFLSMTGICLVGAAPEFKRSKLQNHVHVVGAYVAIISVFLFLALQGVEITDFSRFFRVWNQHFIAGFQGTAEHLEDVDRTNEWIDGRFEDISRYRGIDLGFTDNFLIAVRMFSGHRFQFVRCGHELADHLENRAHADIIGRRAHHNRFQIAIKDTLTQTAVDFLLRQFFAAEVFF